MEDQLRLEDEAVDMARAEYALAIKRAAKREQIANTRPVERVLLHWLPALIAEIRREQRATMRAEPGVDGRSIYGPVLNSLKPQVAAVVVIREALQTLLENPAGVHATSLFTRVGGAIIAERGYGLMREHDRAVRKARPKGDDVPKNWGDDELLTQLTREFRTLTPRRVKWWATRNLGDENVMNRTKLYLGKTLMWLLHGIASADDYDKPFALAFHQFIIMQNRRRRRLWRLDRRILDIIYDGHEAMSILRPCFLPMVMLPVAWAKDSHGGWVRLRKPMVGGCGPEQREAMKSADLTMIHEGLNALNSVPSRINRWTLRRLEEFHQRGDSFAGVPTKDNVPVPLAPNIKRGDPKPTREVLMVLRERRAARRENERREQERVDFSLATNAARRMEGFDRIYFPHMLDFRGRAYPATGHLHFQQRDYKRAMIAFADPRPVSERGWWWIKCHAANCWGHGIDKRPMQERVDWADAHMSEIALAGAKPIDNEWWRQAEEPWQFITAARAFVDEEHAKRLPVQIDGTCNGLQHYAALSRDEQTASVVSMVAGRPPSDVYRAVADRAKTVAVADAARGHPIAAIAMRFCVRAVVKQPVMTSVYGVKAYGALHQVRRKIMEIDPGIDGKQAHKIAGYLSQIVLGSIAAVCPGAWGLMQWLARVGREIVEDGNLIRWTSPLGLPVVQEYRNYRKVQIRTLMQSVTLSHISSDAPVRSGKSVNAFAPNYVHSIDKSHMFMVAIEAKRRNVAFQGIHDGFRTHASDMDELAAIVREKFAELHGRHLIAELHDELSRRYPSTAIETPPEPGGHDVRSIVDCPFSFC